MSHQVPLSRLPKVEGIPNWAGLDMFWSFFFLSLPLIFTVLFSLLLSSHFT